MLYHFPLLTTLFSTTTVALNSVVNNGKWYYSTEAGVDDNLVKYIKKYIFCISGQHKI